MSQSSFVTDRKIASAAAVPQRVVDAVSDAVGKLRYGVVQLTVHDGKVVQLDVTERQRFT